MAIRETVSQGFTTVTNTFTTVNDRWPAVILSAVDYYKQDQPHEVSAPEILISIFPAIEYPRLKTSTSACFENELKRS